MIINNVCQNLCFTSGLNSNLVKQSQNARVSDIEVMIRTKGIYSNLHSIRPVAFALQKVFEVFDNLYKKTNKKIFSIHTPSIQTYTPEALNFNFTGYGFCIPNTQIVIKNEKPSLTGSIFYPEENSIEELDMKLNESFFNGERSSSHYLAPFIHEILHSTYLNFIYQKFGYEGTCPITQCKYAKENNVGLKVLQVLQSKVFSNDENKLIGNILGGYAVKPQNQYHEVFAETFTKLICDNLSQKTSMPIANPLDSLKQYPIDFLKIVAKLFNF